MGFFDQEFKTILGTAGMVFVSYIGLTQIASISEEVKNPERNIPRGMLAAFGTVLFVYLVGTFIMVGVLPAAELANDLTPVAISRGKPRWFKGEEEESLFPSWDMIKNVSNLDDASWETKYQFENLNLLDPEATAKELEGKVLMCWEGPGKFCHRQCEP